MEYCLARFALVAVLRMPDRKSLATAARAACLFVAVALAFLLLNVGLRWAFQVPPKSYQKPTLKPGSRSSSW